ncbi:methyl-accepting chemotaxis protein [Chitinimonas sp.]|uniref:methyl-accepting chemotaxis protein n=1 Tax=Chitinimonas sp. TaxID=1934313 RepID=UPI002F95A55E
MRISQKLALAFAALVVFVVAMGSLGIASLAALDSALVGVTDDALPGVRYTGAIRAEAIDFRNRETQLLIAKDGEEIKETVGRLAKNLEALKGYEAEYGKYVREAGEKALYADYQAKLAAYLQSHDQFVQVVQGGDHAAALAYFRGDSRKAFRSFLPVVDKMVEYNTKAADGLTHEAHADYAQGRNRLVAIAIVVSVLALALSWWMVRSITGQLVRLSSTIREIQRDLDFTRRVEVRGNDEVADTARAFNALAENVQGVLRSADSTSGKLIEMVRELTASAHQVSEGSRKQSDASSSMAAAIEQLSTSISHLADNAREAMSHSVEAEHHAEDGGKVIGSTVEEMSAIASSIEQTAHAMRELDQRSAEIGSIVQVIREVADQTNLLALNAAIEAARAGEQGRGFAVVADEVRKLAERTTAATSEIGSKIAGIQQSAQHAAGTMGKAVQRVSSGVEYAQAAGKTVQTITSDAHLVENEVQSISTALKEQDQVGHQIASAVEQIANMVERNSQAAEHTSQHARELADIASSMRQEIARFRA